jgi:hypothetical protein
MPIDGDSDGKMGKKKATADDLSFLNYKGHHGNDEKTPAPKRKRKRADNTKLTKKISRKRSKKAVLTEFGHAELVLASVLAESPQASCKPRGGYSFGATKQSESLNGEGGETVVKRSPIENDPAACYLDIDLWKQERKALDGSFPTARAHFAKRGPWHLPKKVGDTHFPSVAKQTLHKMDRWARSTFDH